MFRNGKLGFKNGGNGSGEALVNIGTKTADGHQFGVCGRIGAAAECNRNGSLENNHDVL